MAFYAIPTYKNTVVAIDGTFGLLQTNTTGSPQGFLPKTHGAYNNMFDADGETVIGYSEICPSVVDLCIKPICGNCERICILVPEELAGTEPGTPLFVDEYEAPENPEDAIGVEIPPVALAGAIAIGCVAPEKCESPSYWDNLRGEAIAPEGFIYMEVDAFASSVVKLAGL